MSKLWILAAFAIGAGVPFVCSSRPAPVVGVKPAAVPAVQSVTLAPREEVKVVTPPLTKAEVEKIHANVAILTAKRKSNVPDIISQFDDLPVFDYRDAIAGNYNFIQSVAKALNIPVSKVMQITGLHKSSGSHRKGRLSAKLPKITVQVHSGSAATQRSIMRGHK